MGGELPRAALLHGDPGLGKTLVAHYLGSNLGTDVPMYELLRGPAWVTRPERARAEGARSDPSP